MTSRLRTLALVPTLLAAGLLAAGCSEDAVREQAEGLASQAAGSASAAAADALREQLCQVVEDANISSSDITALRGLVDAADAAGVDAEVLDPVREIVDAGQSAPADAVQRLDEACGPPA